MEWTKYLLHLVAIVSTCLQTFLLFAYVQLYQQSLQKSQRLFLINTNVCQALQNIIWLFSKPFVIQNEPINGGYIIVVKEALHGILYFNLIFIAVERVGKFLLNMNYLQYWNAQRTQCLLILTWTSIFATSIAIYSQSKYKEKFQRFRVTTYIFFVVAVITSYFVVIVRHGKSSKSVRLKLKKSVFIVPSLLVTTFVIFSLIPHIVMICYDLKEVEVSEENVFVCNLLNLCTALAHAGLCIALLSDVRKFLFLKVTIFFDKVKCDCQKGDAGQIQSPERYLLHQTPVDAMCSRRLQENLTR